jgi:hypothetical protein
MKSFIRETTYRSSKRSDRLWCAVMVRQATAMLKLMVLVAAVILATTGRAGANETTGFSIPLRISSHPAVAAPEGWPTTTGVPFEKGQLQEAQLKDLRLIGPEGQAVAAQFEVRGRYPSTRAIRWLGVTWQLVPGAKEYRLVLEAQPTKRAAAPEPRHPVQAEEVDGTVRITTGKLKALIKPGQGLLSEVWLGDRLLLRHGEGDGDWLTTLPSPRGGAGVRHSGQVETVTVERRGPLHATVLVEGKYVPAASQRVEGRRPCEFRARLHFHAGRPEVWITHQFIWVGHSDDLQIADLAITFGLGQPATEASLDRSADLGDQPFQAPLPGGGMVAVLQDELYHWGHGKSHFGIHTGTPEKPTETLSGERAGGWIAARGKHGGVTLALRNLWQMYPKELRAEPTRLTAYLWATHGKALPFDVREANLKAIWGPVAMASIKDLKEYKDTFDNPDVMDATGLSRAHDLLLRFEEPGGDAGARSVLECFEHYPVASPDPGWVEQSGVLQYKFSAPNPGRPELERWRNGLFDQIRRNQEKWGDYGFLYFGQGPHMGHYRPNPPPGQEKMSMLMYGQTYPTPYWFGFLQSGDRLHFAQALNHAQFYLDTKLLHASGPYKRKGDFNWFGRRGTIPWAGTPRRFHTGPIPAVWPDRGHYISLEFGLLHYYLTGDRFARDALESTAQLFRDYTATLPRWPEDLLKHDGFRSTVWKVMALKIGDLAMFYELTGDAYFLDHASRLLKGLIDPAQLTRLRATKDPGWDTANLDFGQRNLLRYLRVAEDAGLKEEARLTRIGLMGMAEYKRRVDFSHEASGPLMAFAWEQTKDPVYLRLGLDQLSLQINDDRLKADLHIGSHTGADALRNIAALCSPLAEAGPLPPRFPLLVKYDGEKKATTVLLEKEKGKPLEVEFTAQSQTLQTPEGKPWPEAWLGKPLVYHPSTFAYRHTTKRPLQYFRGAIPAEAPAGEYRIVVPADGFVALLGTNAVRHRIEDSRGSDSK